jgi:large subunit ribosomal protein L21
MYAVIEQGGKQEKVEEGDRIMIELVDAEPQAGTVVFDKVLFVSDGKKFRIGAPYVDAATVEASFETTAADSIVKGKKLYPTHLRRRKNSRKRTGHRQKYMEVTVTKIKSL